MESLIDFEEEESHTGRPSIPILKNLVQACYLPAGLHGDDMSGIDSADQSNNEGDSRKTRYRCRGVTKSGGRCPTSWGSHMQSRILRHAKDCLNLKPELRKAASELCANHSPVPILEEAEKETAKLPPKRICLDVTQCTVDTNQTKLDGLVVPAGSRAELQTKLDAAILLLICTGGLPPTIANSAEWKRAWLLASNNKYRPPSSDVLVDDLIPSEAARVRKLMMDLLTSENIDYVMIGFDGGATVGRDSFTTVHATTSERHAFFLDGECTTGVQHTGLQYADTLEPVSAAELKFPLPKSDNSPIVTSGFVKLVLQRLQVVYPTTPATQN